MLHRRRGRRRSASCSAHLISSQGKPPFTAWSIEGDGSISSPFRSTSAGSSFHQEFHQLADHRLALGPHLRRLGGQDVGHRACLAELFGRSLAVATRQGRRVILQPGQSGRPGAKGSDRRSGPTASRTPTWQLPSSSCRPVRCWQVLSSIRCATSFQTALPPYNRTASAVWISTVRPQRRQETRSTWR